MSPDRDSAWLRDALDLDTDAGGRRYESVVIDSREVEPGALFVALPGETHHGFDFLEDVAGRGARGAVIPADREPPDLDLEWFPVPDPREALMRLATVARRESDARVLGITGSSGKTTVKEMVAAALGGPPRVYRTAGNLNSQIGLPLTVLAAPREAEVWVLELGTNAPGEIGRLTEISAPDDAVVTTVGPAHLEQLGDESGVLDEKLDLVRGASPEGTVVVGERPATLPRETRRIRSDAIVAGLGDGADFRPESWVVQADHVVFRRDGVRYRIQAGGEHHLRDAVLAAAVADAYGVDPDAAAAGLARFRPLGMRGALRQFGALTVVADCYNANPESFEAAVAHCVQGFPERPRAAAVGTMLELGERSEEAHRAVARRLLETGFSPIVATGEFVPAFEAEAIDDGGRVLYAEDGTDAGRTLADELAGNEVVLVKASRGARLEAAIEPLEAAFGDAASGAPSGAPEGGDDGGEGDGSDGRGNAGAASARGREAG